MDRLELGEGTFVTATEGVTNVRGGGYGADAWLAKITGPDPKFGFTRQFVKKDTSGLSGSGRSGSIRWDITENGIYEWRKFCIGSTSRNWESSGFCVIEDGSVREITKSAAIELVSKSVLA
ncbi:hypothetical protein [Ferrimicrobium acidiphilum]|uniref:hypothetical protein n=1 Tax=Ferrimicrobium acidiphilum TaxID=121039 RepID=UPI0023F44177|nr:hypothetical protein [Ferrimicrobium acidiphilum]